MSLNDASESLVVLHAESLIKRSKLLAKEEAKFKTYLHTTMCQVLLSSLRMLSIESQRIIDLNIDPLRKATGNHLT